MPFALNDYIQIRALCFNVNQLSVNVIHYKLTGVTPTFTDQAFADALSTSFASRYKPFFGPGVQYKGIILNLWPITPTSLQVTSTASAGNGTAGAVDQLPPFVAGVITKRTVGRGRQFRGRLYTPFPHEGANDQSGLPTSAYRTTMASLANDLVSLTVLPGTGTVTCTGQLYRRTANLFEPLTTATPSIKWGLMHKRSDYGKTNVSPI